MNFFASHPHLLPAVGLVCYAVYEATVGDYAGAGKSFLGALGLLGVSIPLASLYAATK